MKVFLLADGSSAHTARWVKSLLKEGVELCLFSLNLLSEEIKELDTNKKIKAISAKYVVKSSNSLLKKIHYLRTLSKLKKEITDFNPDLLHAHYISSYGLLAYLSRFNPYVLSVWGSDLMVFPKKSFIHRKTIKAILGKSKMVFSSSQLMLKELQEVYAINHSLQIPFGVDLTTFFPRKEIKMTESFVFVITKSLMPTYGIDIAIEAFVDLLAKYPSCKLILNIYGEGEKREEYEELAGKHLGKQIFFHGKIVREKVPLVLRASDVLINISRYESFGVSVLEAAASGLPVIVSDRGGLKETLEEDKTGIVLKKLDKKHCLEAMEEYIFKPEKYKAHANAAREFVEKRYNEVKSVVLQKEAYAKVLKEYTKKQL